MVVLFDIGNCLYDPHATFRGALARIGKADQAARILSAFGTYLDQPGRQDDLLRQLGFSHAEVRAYFDAFIGHPALHAGVPDVLDRLRASGASLGVVSDGHFDTQIAKLKAWGLTARFDAHLIFIGSTDVTRARIPGDYPDGTQLAGSKREADTFTFIRARIRERPGDGFMVGDDFVRDALNPTKAGLRGIWFVPNEQAERTLPAGADPASVTRITHLTQLEDLVFPPSVS